MACGVLDQVVLAHALDAGKVAVRQLPAVQALAHEHAHGNVEVSSGFRQLPGGGSNQTRRLLTSTAGLLQFRDGCLARRATSVG